MLFALQLSQISSFFSQGPWLLCIYSDLNLSAVGGCLNRLSNTGMSEKIISLLDASTQPSDPARQLRATLQCVWWNSAGRDILRWLVQFFAIMRDLFDEAIKKQSKAIRHSDEDTKAGFFKQLAFVSTIASSQIQKMIVMQIAVRIGIHVFRRQSWRDLLTMGGQRRRNCMV